MEELIKAKEYLLQKGMIQPEVGVVLGTGLHRLLDYVHVEQEISYADIPGFPVSTVEFHKGQLIYGTLADGAASPSGDTAGKEAASLSGDTAGKGAASLSGDTAGKGAASLSGDTAGKGAASLSGDTAGKGAASPSGDTAGKEAASPSGDTAGNKKVLIMQGRLHAYEGYSMQQIVFPIRVMKLLGIRALFLSNAAGGIRPDLKKADLVMVDDHINLLSGNPLSGPNYDELGGRFPDMSEPYDRRLQKILEQKAAEAGIELKKGVYAAVHGPNLETRAEYRYLRTIGADMVGMSTVPEVIAAVHMRLPCAAVSVITDECDPDHLQPVKLPEILAAAAKADVNLSKLFLKAIQEV